MRSINTYLRAALLAASAALLPVCGLAQQAGQPIAAGMGGAEKSVATVLYDYAGEN
jgi:hypothetical protein